jgi:hypothetical protein
MEGRWYLDLDALIMGISIEALRFVARLADGRLPLFKSLRRVTGWKTRPSK